MSAVKFFFDQHVPEYLADYLLRHEPSADVLSVGDEEAPPLGTLDPELLQFAEAQGYALVTLDKKTMFGHLDDHYASGRHTWGVFMLRRDFANERYGESLLIIWSCSQAEEWRDRVFWLPF